MPSFEYRAVDERGRAARGALAADSERDAYRQLRQLGLYPTELAESAARREAAAAAAAGSRRARGRLSLSGGELVLLSRQMATLAQAGLPIETALGALLSSQAKPKLKRIVAELQVSVREGNTLAHAIGALPNAFPSYFPAAIASGERTGELTAVLEQLAQYVENREETRSKAATALIYPALVAVFSLGVALILLLYVGPEVAKIFERSNQPLPTLTSIMLGLGDFLKANAIVLLLLIGGAVAALVIARRRPQSRAALDALMLRLPVIGPMVRGRNAAMFLSAFSIVMASRVPVVEGLDLSTRVLTNAVLRSRAEGAVRLVAEGRTLAAALGDADILPPISLLLIEDGERSGMLEAMLKRSATIVEREINTAQQRIVSLIEPLMMVFVGGMVLTIVLAILLPIFGLQDALMR